MNELVHLEDIHRFYQMGETLVRALDGITLRIVEGEHVAIMGHSGSGKSTLLNVLGCLDRPTAGQYFLGGEDVSDMPDAQLSAIRCRHIGFVFQSFNLISQLTVLGNIEVPLFYQGLPRHERRRRSYELAEMVGLGPRAEHTPTELSGGQQQRVALARALANDPLVLLADEPTGNLDSATTDEILRLFDDLSARGRTIITVTHEENVARHAHRVVQLTDGKVSSDARTERGGAP